LSRKVAWGIDIGESAIKAVRLRRAGDSVVVQDYRTIPCEVRVEEAQAGDKEFRIRTALATLQNEVPLRGSVIAVSIPGRDVFPRFIPLPPVEKRRIPEIVRYEARTQMPFPIEEVIWDYQPISGLDVPGGEVEVALFAIKKATVYGFLTNLRLAGLTPDLVEITPLALYNFLMYDREITTGTVVIDVGAGNTDLVIVDGERFWTRNVSISGNDITRSLQEKYQISFEEAENLKRKSATSKQADKLFGAMRPIIDDLIGEIQRSIGYYKAQTRNVKIERIVLLGNAFKLPRLVEYFRRSLDYEVTLLETLSRVKVAGSGEAEKFESQVPSYAVAIGLALQALGLGRVNIDMMPGDIRHERMLRQKVPYVAAVAGVLAVPLVLGYLSAGKEAARHQGEREAVIQGTHPECRSERDGVAQGIPPERRIRKTVAELQADIERENKVKTPDPKVATGLNLVKGFGQKRLEWAYFVDTLNRVLNKLDRETYRVYSVSEVGESGVPARMQPPGQPAPEALKDALKVEIKFEKDSKFSAEDFGLLRDLLERAGHATKDSSPVRDVEDRGTEAVGAPSGGPARPGGASVVDRGAQGYVYTVWVTFSTEAPAPKPGSPAPPLPPPKKP